MNSSLNQNFSLVQEKYQRQIMVSHCMMTVLRQDRCSTTVRAFLTSPCSVCSAAAMLVLWQGTQRWRLTERLSSTVSMAAASATLTLRRLMTRQVRWAAIRKCMSKAQISMVMYLAAAPAWHQAKQPISRMWPASSARQWLR